MTAGNGTGGYREVIYNDRSSSPKKRGGCCGCQGCLLLVVLFMIGGCFGVLI